MLNSLRVRITLNSLLVVSLSVVSIACAPSTQLPVLSKQVLSPQTKSQLLHVNGIQVLKLQNHAPQANQDGSLDKALCQIAKEELDGEVECQIQATKKVEASSTDASLEFDLSRYEENIGSSIGSSRPASIAIEAKLRSKNTKQVVWSSSYSFSDQALSDNLLAAREKPGSVGRWNAIRSLFDAGVRTLTRELAVQRRESFLAK